MKNLLVLLQKLKNGRLDEFSSINKLPFLTKFQSIRRYSGWTYPHARQGLKVHSDGKNGYLELWDLGMPIQMRGQARTWGKELASSNVDGSGSTDWQHEATSPNETSETPCDREAARSSSYQFFVKINISCSWNVRIFS